MAISNDWNINYLTKQINHMQWKDEITGTDSSVKEVTWVDTVADSTNSLDGKYFTLWSATDATKYHVWYNTSGGSATDPAPANSTAIMVAITTNDTANTVASLTQAAIDATADFVATVSTNRVTITNANFGSCTDAANVDAGFTITVNTQGIGKTVWSTNALYSYIQDTFDELGQMDDQVPMSAQTPTEYSLINGWFIDEVSIKYLNGGAIKTVGWTGNVICQIGYNSGGTHFLHSDIGKVITGTTTSDTATILFFDDRTVDGDQGKLWLRPTSAAADLFNNGTEAYTVASSSAVGVFTSVSISGENTWANMYSIGTIESNTAIYIVQDGTKLNSWWPVDHIDVLIRVREMGSTTGVNSGDLGQLFIGAREYTKLFDHFVSTGITGGRNPVPLATAADLNNTTGQYQLVLSGSAGTFAVGERFQVVGSNPLKEGTITAVSGSNPTRTLQYYLSGTDRTQFASTDVIAEVGGGDGSGTVNGAPTTVVAGYSDITLTFGDITRNLNNGNGLVPYDVEIDLTNTRSVAQMYEWLKFLTMRGYTNSPQQLKYGTGSTANTNIDGEQYIDLLTSFTPVKASPFGTFAGGKFFGAQGVWLKNVPTAYAQSFQLIDATGTTQVPPNTVSVTVSSVVANDVVGVFPLTAAAGTVKKNTHVVTTGTLGANSVIVSAAIDGRVPQSGVIRIVDYSDPLDAETQYEYYSWTGSTFTLNSSTARSLSLTATGSSGSTTVLVDTDATFQTWKVRPGDVITATGNTATVVSVDSETQLTTTPLSSSGTYTNNEVYTFETQLLVAAESGVDNLYIPIINEKVISPATSVSNTLIYTAPVIPVLVRVRQGKVILPFEIENEIGSTGMSQAAIRTADTIAT